LSWRQRFTRGEEDVRGRRIRLPSLAITMLSLFFQAAWGAQEDAPGGMPRHIVSVLLGTGGVLGVGEPVRAVPWTTMRVEPIERVVVLDIAKGKLHNAPPLEAGVWEETASRKWLAGVYTCYGARPYWESGD
jgi:hypothetical protein